MLCYSHRIVFMCWTCIHPYALCSIDCMFKWSFALLCDHCNHFHITVWCLIKLFICFTSCLLDRIFTCYIIVVILLLALPWGSNMFYASVSSYKYTCSKFIIGFRFRSEEVLPLFPNSCLSLESILGCFCHGITKRGNYKVLICNYVLCWLYSMTKSVLIAINYFLVFCGILLYLV